MIRPQMLRTDNPSESADTLCGRTRRRIREIARDTEKLRADSTKARLDAEAATDAHREIIRTQLSTIGLTAGERQAFENAWFGELFDASQRARIESESERLKDFANDTKERASTLNRIAREVTGLINESIETRFKAESQRLKDFAEDANERAKNLDRIRKDTHAVLAANGWYF